MNFPTSILIIGAGQAAAVAIAQLRENGYRGAITMVGEEPHLPYERPPLSKDFLSATAPIEPVISIKPSAFYDDNNVSVLLSTQVTRIDTSLKSALLSNGTTIRFDKCLIATGGTAKILPDFPETAERVFYLRTLDDARRLRKAMAPGKRIVIIGAGFLGLEIASTACTQGLEADVIEYAPRALARVAPPEFSQWLHQQAETAGTKLHLGARISRVTAPSNTTAPWQIDLGKEHTVSADLVVVAIGLSANVTLARQAGLETDLENGGICVNTQCCTSHPDIYAAGDCTSQQRNNNEILRLESWQNANEQARIAANAMLGIESEPAAYPWFWTDQFGHNIQMLGLPNAELTYLTRIETTNSGAPQKIIFLGLYDKKPVNALAINAGGDLRALRPLFENSVDIDPDQFTDTHLSVRAFAKQTMSKAVA